MPKNTRHIFMKRQNKKLLTLMLTGALCASMIGGGATMVATADEATTAAYSQTLTNVFTSGKDLIGVEAKTAKFSFTKDSEVKYTRDLAWKWFTEDGAQYLNFEFEAGGKYTDISFVFETTPAQAVEGDKAINTIKFYKEGKVAVFSGEEEPENVVKNDVALTGSVKVALTAGANYGEFAVLVDGEEKGTFTNVGANYADHGEVNTMVIKATPVEETENPYVLFKNLNGQSFNKIEEGMKVNDDAAPVLVVNQDVSGFLLGTAFSLDYAKVDVLQASGLSETKQYYQYNPTDTEIKMNTLSTSTYFMDTAYQKDQTWTSVYAENGEEYVNIRFTLKDGSKAGAESYEYDLSWYVTDAENNTEVFTVGTGEKADERAYIILDRNEEGPQYKNITADANEKKNVAGAQLAGLVEAYQKKLEENASEIYAGSNAEIQLPALDWFITDNNGYNTLLFTISYRTPTSTSPSNSSNKKYNALEIPTTSEGDYEFKVFATDAAGNPMQYYLDGELVKVTTDNVWDIEEIPSFTFEVDNKGIKTADGEDGDTLDSKILEESYTMTEVKILGASDLQSAHTLFKFNEDFYNALPIGSAKKISEIKFADLNKEADALLVGKELNAETDYMAVYKQAFLKLLAEKLGKTEADVANCLEEIDVYDSTITEDDEEAWEASDNKYNWSASSRRFTAAETGLYLILADYWDEDLSLVDRVPAYQLIEVQDEKDVIKGASEWLENNLVSIILFSISGVLAIAIIVLLFVKPSKETLEDVDKKVKKVEKK